MSDNTTTFIVQAIVGASQFYVPTSVPHCQRPTTYLVEWPLSPNIPG